MDFNLIGPSYSQLSVDLNAQERINFYPVVDESSGFSSTALYPTPGLTQLANITASSPWRAGGLISTENFIFGVLGSSLYKMSYEPVSKALTTTLVGSLSTSTGPITMARGYNQIVFSDGTYGYVYNFNTSTYTQITDVNFLGASALVYLDGFFIYSKTGSNIMYASSIEDGTTWPAVNQTTSNANGDLAVNLAINNRELYVFGTNTVEIWYDAGNTTGFPFSRRPEVQLETGCANGNLQQSCDRTLYWMDENRYIVTLESYKVKIISTDPINQYLQSLGSISDAYAFTTIINGHWWYVISLPSAKVSLVYDTTTKQWFKWEYFNPGAAAYEHHRMSDCIMHKQRCIGTDRQSGKVWLVDPTVYLDGADPIVRTNISHHAHEEFHWLRNGCIEIKMETGVGVNTGQGITPQIMMQISKDGGHTYGNELWRGIGALGQYKTRIRWNGLGQSKVWTIKHVISDPVKAVILGCSLKLQGLRNKVTSRDSVPTNTSI